MDTHRPDDVSKLHVRSLLDGGGTPRLTDAFLRLLSGPEGNGTEAERAERVTRVTLAWDRLEREHPDQHAALLLTMGHQLKLRQAGRRLGRHHDTVRKLRDAALDNLRDWCA